MVMAAIHGRPRLLVQPCKHAPCRLARASAPFDISSIPSPMAPQGGSRTSKYP